MILQKCYFDVNCELVQIDTSLVTKNIFHKTNKYSKIKH